MVRCFKSLGMKTLVLVVAVTNVNNPHLSCFSPTVRLGQLKNTVNSVRDKIPESFIVILEGSTLTPEQQKIFDASHQRMHDRMKKRMRDGMQKRMQNHMHDGKPMRMHQGQAPAPTTK